MEAADAATVVAEINTILQRELWFFFEVTECTGYTLTIMGGLDDSAPYDMEIWFKDVFFVSLPMRWGTDTAAPPLQIVTGQEAYKLNRQIQVQQGYHIFRFTPEGYAAEFGCLVAAAEIGFQHPMH